MFPPTSLLVLASKASVTGRCAVRASSVNAGASFWLSASSMTELTRTVCPPSATTATKTFSSGANRCSGSSATSCDEVKGPLNCQVPRA
jgi:hypothetical protein